MPVAEIITIGTELLLGEIQDTNTRYLARALRDIGVDIYRSTMVGDNEDRIAQAIREAMQRSNIIITTGGLGPTVDDPTRQAVAHAVGVELEYRPELWEQIQNRFQRFNRTPTENNRRQAYVPQGAQAIINPVGTAPAFLIERTDQSIISLPGVPREMEYLIEHAVVPYLKLHFALQGTIKARVLHAAGIGESQVDEWVSEYERLDNPTVGLLAHAGQIDIRITAKAESDEEANEMIAPIETEIRRRMDEHIYGADSETLAEVMLRCLAERSWRLGIIECGLNGEMHSRLAGYKFAEERVKFLTTDCQLEELAALAQQWLQSGLDAVLCVHLLPGAEQQSLSLIWTLPEEQRQTARYYGGPQAMSPLWAANTALDFVRRNL